MKYAFLGRCAARHHSGTQERMREAETLILDLENPRLEGLGQSGLRAPADHHVDKACRRVGEQGDDARNLDPGSPEPIEALLNQVCEIRGDRQLRARIQPTAASSLKRPDELEREERIPTDVSQTRRSVGRASSALPRARSSSWSAPTLNGLSSRVSSRSSATSRPSHCGTSSRAVRITVRDPSRGGTKQTATSPTTVRRAIGRRRQRVVHGCRRRAFAMRSRRRPRGRPPRRVHPQIPRARARPRAPDAAAAATAATRRRRPLRSGRPTDERKSGLSLRRPSREHQIAARFRHLPAASDSVVLPIPASPTTTAAANRSSGPPSRSRRAASSSSRPTTCRASIAIPMLCNECTTGRCNLDRCSSHRTRDHRRPGKHLPTRESAKKYGAPMEPSGRNRWRTEPLRGRRG